MRELRERKVCVLVSLSSFFVWQKKNLVERKKRNRDTTKSASSFLLLEFIFVLLVVFALLSQP